MKPQQLGKYLSWLWWQIYSSDLPCIVSPLLWCRPVDMILYVCVRLCMFVESFIMLCQSLEGIFFNSIWQGGSCCITLLVTHYLLDPTVHLWLLTFTLHPGSRFPEQMQCFFEYKITLMYKHHQAVPYCIQSNWKSLTKPNIAFNIS